MAARSGRQSLSKHLGARDRRFCRAERMVRAPTIVVENEEAGAKSDFASGGTVPALPPRTAHRRCTAVKSPRGRRWSFRHGSMRWKTNPSTGQNPTTYCIRQLFVLEQQDPSDWLVTKQRVHVYSKNHTGYCTMRATSHPTRLRKVKFLTLCNSVQAACAGVTQHPQRTDRGIWIRQDAL